MKSYDKNEENVNKIRAENQLRRERQSAWPGEAGTPVYQAPEVSLLATGK